MEASDIRRLKDLEDENRRLKQMYADLSLENRALKDVIKKVSANHKTSAGRRFRTFNVVDGFNREVLAIEIDLNLPASRVIRVLDRIAAWRGYPAMIRLDNGPELISVLSIMG